MERRQFIRILSGVVLVVPAGRLLTACDDDGEVTPAADADAGADADAVTPDVPEDTGGDADDVDDVDDAADASDVDDDADTSDADDATDTTDADGEVDADDGDDGADADDADAGPTQLTFTSTVALAHTHDFTIQVVEITDSPSGGVSRETTLEVGHTHLVELTEADLDAIEAGTPVTKTTSMVNAHTHDFVFSLST